MKRILFAAIFIFAACAAVIAVWYYADMYDPAQYRIGSDVIPSITAVVGDRKILSKTDGEEGDIKYIKYTYEAEAYPAKDLSDFAMVLLGEYGFYIMEDGDVTRPEGKFVLAANSATDEERAVYVFMEYNRYGYTLSIEWRKDTITPVEG